MTTHSPRRSTKKASKVTPFWQRIPRFFRYPFYADPAIQLALLSLPFALAPLLRIFTFGLFVAVLFGFIRFVLKVMEQTALGRLHPEQYAVISSSPGGATPLGLFGLYLLLSLILSPLVISLGDFGEFAANLIFSIVQFACVMIYVITGRISSALNPKQILSVITSIGMPYLGLVAFLFMLSLSVPHAIEFAFLIFKNYLFIGAPLIAFTVMYFYLIMFNMMGYVLYQYHEELGYDAAVGFDEANETGAIQTKTKQKSKDQVLEEEIAELLAEDKTEEALDLAYEAQRIAPGNLEHALRYFKLLVLTDKKDKALRYAGRAVSSLIKQEQYGKAYSLYLQSKELGEIEQEEGELILGLAKGAHLQKDHKGFVNLVRGFDAKYPDSRDIPEIYWFSAQVLNEAPKTAAQAYKILKRLIRKYPDHPRSEEARQQVERFEKTNPSLS